MNAAVVAASGSSSKYDQQISVIDGLRRAFEKCKHHQRFTKRIEAILQEELPGFSVCVSPSEKPLSLSSVRVWGLGIEYGNAVYLCWNGSRVWQEGFAHELQRADARDYEERQMDEQALYGQLDAMEAEMATLREQAAALVKKLPIPQSATLRAESVFWDTPSSTLRKRCPLLFGRVES